MCVVLWVCLLLVVCPKSKKAKKGCAGKTTNGTKKRRERRTDNKCRVALSGWWLVASG